VSQPSSRTYAGGSFDVPNRILNVDLVRSPYFPEDNICNTLSCYYFHGLMVKEHDQGCDLHLDGRACREEVKAKLAVKSDAMPVCTDYEHIAEIFATDRVKSKVAYPVEVMLSPQPAVKTVAGPVKCWPTQ
jgi:hypothetical protein